MKKNRLFSLILLVTMFFSLYTQSEVAAEDSAAAFDVVSFKYCNADGTEITDFANFTANQTIKAQATVKNNGASPSDITLILLAYQNGKLIKYGDSTDTFGLPHNVASGATQTLEATIELPPNPTGCTLYSYMWEDLTTMEALSNPAEFGSDNAELEYATVGGKKVTFDENGIGTVVLPASTSGNPAVEIFAKDVSTKLNGVNGILYGDGTITINTISTGGATKEYTVNYTKEPAKLTDVSYVSADTYVVNESDVQNTLKLGTVKPNLVAADFYDEATGDNTKTINDVYGVGVYTGLENYVTPIVSNRYPYWFYMDLPEKFVGMNYIAVPYNNDTVYAGDDTITFTTNKNVRFYVSSTSAWTGTGAVLDGAYTFNHVREGDGSAATQPYSTLKTTSQGANYSFSSNVYKYEVIVPEGETSATAEIKVRSAGTWDFPHIFYEFIDNSSIGDDSSSGGGATPPAGGGGGGGGGTTPPSGGGDTPPAVDNTPANVTNISNVRGTNTWTFTEIDTLKSLPEITDTSKTYAQLLGITSAGAFKDVASRVITDRNAWIYTDIPAKFVGMSYVPWQYDTNSRASVYAGNDTITFTTDKSIRIYYGATSDWVDGDATLDGTYTFSWNSIGDGDFHTKSIADYASSVKTQQCTIYTKDIIVPEDETSITASVKLKASTGSWEFPKFFWETITE